MNFYKLLKQAKDEKKLIGIHVDTNEAAGFLLGYIIEMDDEKFIQALVNPQGEYDGFFTGYIEGVFSATVETEYIYSVEVLFGDKVNSMIDLIKNENGGLFEKIMTQAIANNKIISIQLAGDSGLHISGFIKSWNDKILTLHQIDELGESDGEVNCITDYVTAILFVITLLENPEKLYKIANNMEVR